MLLSIRAVRELGVSLRCQSQHSPGGSEPVKLKRRRSKYQIWSGESSPILEPKGFLLLDNSISDKIREVSGPPRQATAPHLTEK